MSWAAAAKGAMSMMSSQGGQGGGGGGGMGGLMGGGSSGPIKIEAPNIQTKQERNQDIASKSGMSPANTRLGGTF